MTVEAQLVKVREAVTVVLQLHDDVAVRVGGQLLNVGVHSLVTVGSRTGTTRSNFLTF